MPKQKRSNSSPESDGAYLLKITLYAILGSLWLKLGQPLALGPVIVSGLPVGLLIGLLFASHDHFQVDRKIEYAVLLVATIVSYYLPTGIILG